MRVNFRGAGDRTNVKHVSAKTDGTVVLRYSDHKEYVNADDHAGYSVSPS